MTMKMKGLLASAIAAVAALSFAACGGGGSSVGAGADSQSGSSASRLESFRLDAINEMLAYAEAKRTQNIYDDAGEEELSQITDEGLLALYGAADEAEAKVILERVKAAIDAVEPAGSRGE